MNFFRNYLKNIILAVVFIVALSVVGMFNINDVEDIEAQKSSYTRTRFDYFISSPSAEQVAEIESDPSIAKVFPYHAFSNAFSSAKDIFLLASDDMEDSEISLITESTLIDGSYDKNGAMLDYLAAETLGVEVGDTISFNVLGKSISKPVSAIYLTSTYGTLTKGIVLVDFSAELQSVYSPLAYSAAFITVNGKDGAEELLKDYVGEGNVPLSYDEYVEINFGQKPPYQTQEEYEASCRQAYEQFREESLAAALRSGNQVAAKEDAYLLLKDKIDTTEKGIDRLNILGATFSLVLFVILNIIFIITNLKNDRLRCDEGMKFGSMFGQYAILTAATALVVAAFTFLILYILAAHTFFADVCMATVLYFSLPAVVACVPVILFTFFYVRRIYSNSIK